MKSEVTGILNPIEKTELTKLLKETKETIATEELFSCLSANSKKNIPAFTVVDMWNFRKKSRQYASLRERR